MKFSSFSATLFQQVYFPSTKKRKNIASISYRLFLIIFFVGGGGVEGGDGALFRGWTLVRDWMLIQINTVLRICSAFHSD